MLTAKDNDLLCRVGPGTPMGNLFRRFWMPALLREELPEPDGTPVRLRLLGEDLVAYRESSGGIGVVANACPHRGASMFFGRNEENGLRCVYHGWKFDASGACTDMPNEPAESNFRHKIRIGAYPAAEWGGLVWVYMGPADKQPALPQVDWAMVPEGQCVIGKFFQKANYAQAEEGNLDSSHVGFLHRTMDPSLGMAPSQRNRGALLLDSGAPQLTVAETEFGFVYGARRDAPDGNYFWRVTPFQVPCFSTVPGNTWPRLAHAIVPVDDENSIWFEIQYNPFEPLPAGMRGSTVRLIAGTHVTYGSLDNDYTIDREMQKTGNYTGILRGREQDLAVVDSMTPILNRTVEHLGTADAAIIAYRRLLMRLARALEAGEEPWMASHPEAYRVRPLDVVVPEANLNGLIASHRPQVMVGF